MYSLKKHKKNLLLTGQILVLLGILAVSSIACKNPAGPEGESNSIYVIILNVSGETVDIYLDGSFKVTVEHENTVTVWDIAAGNHIFEAKITGTDIVIQSSTVVLDAYKNYDWTVGNIPDINVINQYGETLEVYMDGDQIFTIEHEQNLWILEVSLGEYLLEAKKEIDDQVVVDSITIVIAEYKDYEWTIDGQ